MITNIDMIEVGDPEKLARQWSQDIEVRFTDPGDYLWPFPQAEIEINEEITQNPGY